MIGYLYEFFKTQHDFSPFKSPCFLFQRRIIKARKEVRTLITLLRKGAGAEQAKPGAGGAVIKTLGDSAERPATDDLPFGIPDLFGRNQ